MQQFLRLVRPQRLQNLISVPQLIPYPTWNSAAPAMALAHVVLCTGGSLVVIREVVALLCLALECYTRSKSHYLFQAVCLVNTVLALGTIGLLISKPLRSKAQKKASVVGAVYLCLELVGYICMYMMGVGKLGLAFFVFASVVGVAVIGAIVASTFPFGQPLRRIVSPHDELSLSLR